MTRGKTLDVSHVRLLIYFRDNLGHFGIDLNELLVRNIAQWAEVLFFSLKGYVVEIDVTMHDSVLMKLFKQDHEISK